MLLAIAPPGSAAEDCPAPAAGTADRWPGQQAWLALERAGLQIGSIEVEVDEVYVARDDRLDWYQRLANAIHARSQQETVAEQLTLEPGERVVARRIYEAERQLRRLEFVKDARIDSQRCGNGSVDIVVRSRDAWTLKLWAGIGTAGGESTQQFGVQELNLFGTGKALSYSYDEQVDRSSEAVGYHDPALLGTKLVFDYEYSSFSDGRGNRFQLEQPFRTLDQSWAFRAASDDTDLQLKFYQDNQLAYRLQQARRSSNYEVRRLLFMEPAGAWRGGGGWRREHSEFSGLIEEVAGLRPAPDVIDRDLRGPYLLLERVHDDYASFTNIRAMQRTEDYNLALNARLELGQFEDANGNGNGYFSRLEVDGGSELVQDGLLLYRANFGVRRRGENWEDGRGSISADAYYPVSTRHTWVAHLELDWHERADPEDELYIGGLDGMYGYPQHFRVGDRRWILHGEFRQTSDLVLLDTLRIGYSAFAETGQVHGLDGHWSRQFADVGLGLRIGNLRSAFADTYYVAIVAALTQEPGVERYQLVAGNVIEF